MRSRLHSLQSARVSRAIYTRLRFRGRHPLWGTGVTSWIPRISSPVAASDRMAVSRPDPGPLTNTSTFLTPCSWARRAAASAASWAANGVDLREPLNPTFPALAHEIVFPSRSVIVTIVLLNVDLMCAAPWAMFFFSFFRAFFFGLATYFAFRLTPTVFFGPLRVRALVWVRWPWTGRLRRGRLPWYRPISIFRFMARATA